MSYMLTSGANPINSFGFDIYSLFCKLGGLDLHYFAQCTTVEKPTKKSEYINNNKFCGIHPRSKFCVNLWTSL